MEQGLRAVADAVQALVLDLFDTPNDKAARGRRTALSNRLHAAANAVRDGELESALDAVTDLMEKIGGEHHAWMLASPERTEVLLQLDGWRALLVAMIAAGE